VTSVAQMAGVAAGAGADAVSLVNTFLAMSIDAETRKPRLSNITGGLSGPAIKPIALRMVWQVAKAVKVPIIGIGGIMNATDALEFILAGATAIQVGTASFINPGAAQQIAGEMEAWLAANGVADIKSLIGALET
jgi:dihydroorotate dehydrogenase (NAD+) catalytic subunit